METPIAATIKVKKTGLASIMLREIGEIGCIVGPAIVGEGVVSEFEPETGVVSGVLGSWDEKAGLDSDEEDWKFTMYCSFVYIGKTYAPTPLNS